MMTVWVVVGVLALGAAAVAVVLRRHSRSVEPTVRDFADFRDALSQQVAGLPARADLDRHHNGHHQSEGSPRPSRQRDGLDQTRQ